MNQSDQQIIEQVLLGETHLYSVLVLRYQKKLFNFMFRVCLVKEDAEDLTQESFIKAYEKLESFHKEKSFLNWLFAIALNLFKDSRRKSRLQAEKRKQYFWEVVEKLPKDDSSVDKIAQKDTHIKLSKALSKIPEDYREVIILKYSNELTMKEISEILKISVSGAKMKVSRGLKKLQETFFRD